MTAAVVIACVALVALVALVGLFVWTLDRVLVRLDAERAADARSRDWLLQRVQAPEQAVAMFDPTPEDDEPEAEEESPVIYDEQEEILAQLRRAI